MSPPCKSWLRLGTRREPVIEAFCPPFLWEDEASVFCKGASLSRILLRAELPAHQKADFD